jgi:ketosteroid isomerase-like protein
MKHAFAWLTALAFTLPHISTAQGETMTQDERAVLAVIETMTHSFQAGDIATVMNSYEPQATVVFEPAAPVSDADMIAQMFTGMAALQPEFSYPAGHEVIVNGDFAIHIAPWDMIARTAWRFCTASRRETGKWSSTTPTVPAFWRRSTDRRGLGDQRPARKRPSRSTTPSAQR